MIKWKYKPANNCPVQAEGHFLGYYFYFRSRGSRATIEFSKTEADWEKDLLSVSYTLWRTKDPYNVGWLSKWFCEVLVWVGCFRFLFKRNKQSII